MAVGAFVFSACPHDEAIVVELVGHVGGSEPDGIVRLPKSMIPHVPQSYRLSEEPLRLPFAMGYAVMVGMFFGIDVIVSGDSKLWDSAWGPLSHADSHGTSEAEPALALAN